MTVKLLLDTNILLDYMIPERPEHDAAVAFVDDMLDGHGAYGYVCAGSLKDVYYIARKHAVDERVRMFIQLFMDLLEVLPIDRGTCEMAIRSNEPDFEDGLIRAVAEQNGIDFIISRDQEAFERSVVRSMSASRYIALFK